MKSVLRVGVWIYEVVEMGESGKVEEGLECREDRILIPPSICEIAAAWWPRSVYVPLASESLYLRV